MDHIPFLNGMNDEVEPLYETGAVIIAILLVGVSLILVVLLLSWIYEIGILPWLRAHR